MDVLVLVQPSVVPREVVRAVNVVGFSPDKYKRNPNDKNTSSLQENLTNVTPPPPPPGFPRKKFLKYVPHVYGSSCVTFRYSFAW